MTARIHYSRIYHSGPFQRKALLPICRLARWTSILIATCFPSLSSAQQDKSTAVVKGTSNKSDTAKPFALPQSIGGSAHRTTIGSGDHQFPLVVVRGTPYEMGLHLGRAFQSEMQKFVPAALAGIQKELGVDQAALQETWARSAAYADDRIEQELAGLSDGSGLPLALLQSMHAVPLLMPYSCSSIAAWGNATEDGHLYQTRNLDWSMQVGAHEFPMIVLYIPSQGIPHVVPSFAGMIGAHTGMNTKGIALSEMGDASQKEAPYPNSCSALHRIVSHHDV
jgi:hypothetical protein